MIYHTITGKDNGADTYKELVFEWSDGTMTGIAYSKGGFRAKYDRRKVLEQYNTYGERAAKELAECLAVLQAQFEQRLAEENKMNTYQLWNIYDPLLNAPSVIEGKTMKDAIERYMGDELKPNQYIKQTKNTGNFVISKYPVYTNTKRYTFGVYQNA